MISYAQNFEDVVLDRVFHDVEHGRYIDVGAFDPTQDSVTRHFYDRGWSGVNIEPVERFHRRFVAERPRDTNLNVAVGSAVGSVDFHEWGDSGLSTYRETFDAALATALPFERRTYTVPLTTLAAITAGLDDRPIDFLKVDVEGAERDVLQGADWRAFRPRVVVVEAVRPRLITRSSRGYEPAWFEWEGMLLDNGYEFALFDGLNRFYHRREEPGLRPLLSYPANVTDCFTLRPGHFLTLPKAA
jgi:FkbM family methyltransferase